MNESWMMQFGVDVFDGKVSLTYLFRTSGTLALNLQTYLLRVKKEWEISQKIILDKCTYSMAADHGACTA